MKGTSVNNISATIRIEGRIDSVLLQRSIQQLIKFDENLRTRIILDVDGNPQQEHIMYQEEQFPLYDLSHAGEDGMKEWEDAMTRETIPVLDGPLYRFVLFRTGENSGGVLIKTHHIISDGFTLVLLCNRITKYYLDLLAEHDIQLEEVPNYQVHVEEEKKYLSSRAYKKDKQYWESCLSIPGEPSMLKSIKSAAISPVGKRYSVKLPQILNHEIFTFCEKNRVAPFAVYYMALAIYFKRLGGADRFTVGVPIINRSTYQFKQCTGMFVTTLPFINVIDDHWTFNEFNERLMENWLDLLRHQRFPYTHIEKLNQEMNGDDGRLFNIALSYQDGQVTSSKDAAVHISGRWHYSGYQAEQLCIHLTNLFNHKQYSVDYDYLAQFFTEDEIKRFHDMICTILYEALSNPDKPIKELNILTLEEKEKVLYGFNQTDCHVACEDVYGAIEQRAKEYPERVAAIVHGERFTYETLVKNSAKVAIAETEICREENGLFAILLPRSFELLTAMTGTLKAGNAFMLLSTELPSARIEKILMQSRANGLITSSEVLESKELCFAGDILCFEDILRKQGREITIKPHQDDLAYVVYTSGSTGEPKGVEITQKNLCNLAQSMETLYGKGAVLSICNVGFDAFVLESVVPLMNGKTIVVADEKEVESPKSLAKLISGYAVGFCAMTPSRLAALLKDRDFREAVKRLEAVLCGGEAFSASLLKELKHLTRAKIYNQYGPSEATVAVSYSELSHAERITVGKPMNNCRLYVLDKWLNPLPAGVYGRLFAGGCCVGKGYHHMPELTEVSFFDSPFESGERIYNTGDSACWTEDGEILLAGRTDNQIKIHGLRIEPDEIAACLSSYEGVTQAVVKICEIEDEPLIIGYYCCDRDVREMDILSFAATYLPHYMLPAKMVKLDEIPMTSNGKIAMHKLPIPVFEEEFTTRIIVEGSMESKLLDIFKRVLEKDELTVNSDYFIHGGNSLNALSTITYIEEELGIRLRVADLYAGRTASRLAQLLGEEPALDYSGTALEKAPRLESYPLSKMQQGIYVQSYLDPTGISYNMPGAFKLPKTIDLAKLETVFHQLIADDPIFRTSFRQGKGGIQAFVEDQVSFALGRLQGNSSEEVMDSFVKPFKLDQAPLLRAAVWRNEEGEQILFVDSHHIIGDGLSTPIILKRMNHLYRDQAVEIPYSYLDYAWHEQQNLETDMESLQFWTEHLQQLPDAMNLPGDYSRPHDFDFVGGEYKLWLGESMSKACDQFCKEKGITSYMLFLGAFSLLMSKLSGKDDLIIGIPSAGRKGTVTQTICGPFIHTLPLRIDTRNRGRSQYLEDIRDIVNHALDHQYVGLEDIISALNLPRSAQNSLYQVMFSQSPVDAGSFVLNDEPLAFVPIPAKTVKMDMTCESARQGNTYYFTINYAKQLFLPETIAYFGRCLKQIIQSLIKPEEQQLSQLQILASEDYAKYVEMPNYAATPFINLPIQKIIQQSIFAAPDETAIIFHGKSISRLQLEHRANAIAVMLKEAGAEPGECIGMAFARTPDLIAAMIGILKAGCAYVPLLPSYPEARLSYMLETAKAPILLCDEKSSLILPANLPAKIVVAKEGMTEHFDTVQVKDSDLVNVMFTSGSTGKPKGVMLKHRSVSSLYVSIRELLARVDGPILCTTNVVFDSFIGESLFPLAMGKRIIMADEEEMMLPWKLANLIEEEHVEVFQVTPARLQMCLGNEAFCNAAAKLKLVLLGGEVLTPQLLDHLHEVTDAISVNMYGPTEGTVYMTMIDVVPGDHITIGRPIYNNRIYVLDENLNPVIPTACGELYMAGECLARGYISREDLTEKAFIPDVFFPGEKMYKSGDLGRLRLDGSYDFLGRSDSQVKLNGQRVELDEITNNILQSGGAKQAATIPLRKEEGAMELWTFFEPKETEEESREVILSYIKKSLPAYMIPSRFVAMERIPFTPSSKIDLQQLQKIAQEMACKREVVETVPADSEPKEIKPEAIIREIEELQQKKLNEKTEETITPDLLVTTDEGVQFVIEMWKKVLTKSEIDPDVSFFEQGGTSLDALSVLSEYFNHQKEMSLAQFYEHATARSQAKLLGFTVEKSKVQDAVAERNKPQKNLETALKDAEQIQPTQFKSSVEEDNVILLTGATGFFGIHLMKVLLEQSETQIICLLRDGDRKRLLDLMRWYFGPMFVLQMENRIQVIKGDLCRASLGMDSDAYVTLSKRVNKIYHCAADVRHYAADEHEYLQTNVDGTKNMLKLAEDAKASFYHMSTCSVSGTQLKESDKECLFTERDFDIGQVWEDNIYVKSKFLAEKAVYEAMDRGLDAKIFRLGRLVGRSEDGVFQKNPDNNAFYLLMRAFHLLGFVPETIADVETDLTPIDYAAETVAFLADTAEEHTYHILSPCPPTVRQIIEEIDSDIVFMRDDDEFTEVLIKSINGPYREEIAVAVDYWYQIRFQRPQIDVRGEITQSVLNSKGFQYQIPSPGLLLRTFSQQKSWKSKEEK